MSLFLDKASYRAEKLLIDINLPPLMPDENINLGSSLGLDKKMMTSCATQDNTTTVNTSVPTVTLCNNRRTL